MSSQTDISPAETGEGSPPAEGSRKRQQILSAAKDLFMAHGYGAVSMDAVARTAEVSKATLYAYFASKDALFATILGEACARNSTVLSLFDADTPNIGQALRAIGGRGLRFLLKPETLATYRMVVAESERFPELGRAFWTNGPEAFRNRFAGWLARQAAAGRLATPDPFMAADQFMALLRGGLFLRASLAMDPPPSEAEIDATVEAAVTTFLRAYAPENAVPEALHHSPTC